MRLHGYCERCHRVRLVNVKVPLGNVPVGVCDECETGGLKISGSAGLAVPVQRGRRRRK